MSTVREIFLRLFRTKPTDNLDFNNQLESLKKIENHDNPRLIISLTSYGHRIERTAPLSIVSLFKQSVLPDKIILWLAYDEKPSASLRKLEEFGLDIQYTEDTKSYKKLIPTLSKYPESIIVTVDDDMLYPETWLEKTIRAYENNKGKIIVNRGRKIIVKNGQIAHYVEWPLLVDNSGDSHFMLPTGAGGVLYPPSSLDERVMDSGLFMNLAPHADDLWFWAMAELKGTERYLVEDGFSNTVDYELDNSNINRLSIVNVDPNNENNNDSQLNNILNKFPVILETLRHRSN